MENRSFKEYVDAKGKMKKPVVDVSGDQLDVKSTPKVPKVKKNGKGKNAGFGDMGDKSLIFKYDLKSLNGAKPAKLPTAEQLQITGSFIGQIESDPTLVETFIKQARSNNILPLLVVEIFEHKESISHLAEILANENYGPKLMKKLSAALNEEVSKPFSDQLEGEGDEDPAEEDLQGQEGDMQVGVEPENQDGMGAAMDPNTQPPMGDPNMIDPNMPMDPSMGAQPPVGDPNMMAMQQPMNPVMTQMQKFQKAMMRAYQRAMMRKQ